MAHGKRHPYRFGREVPTLVESESGDANRIENTAGVEVDPATEQTVGSVDESLGNRSNVYTDELTSDGSFTSLPVQDGDEVVYLADPNNDNTVTLDGFPLPPGMSVTLGVEDVAVPSFNVASGDSVHALVETDTAPVV